MDGGGCISLGGVSDTNIHFVLRLGSGIAINFLNMKSTRCTTMFSTFAILLLLVQISLGEEEVNDNRGQCVPGYSGIICYPIDCCHRFVQCVNGVIYPPQVETNSFFKIVRCSRNQLYEQRNCVSE